MYILYIITQRNKNVRYCKQQKAAVEPVTKQTAMFKTTKSYNHPHIGDVEQKLLDLPEGQSLHLHPPYIDLAAKIYINYREPLTIFIRAAPWDDINFGFTSALK